MQIAIYARVSTGRQAENDLSIPDQLRQMREWAERNSHVVVKEYIEPGASATDDKRPVFQNMIQDAEQKPTSFQLIAVHSLSRFFRDLVQGAMYQKKLHKLGIKLVSIAQQTNDDPSGDMQRHIFMLFDEYQSKEIAKHVLRGMQENARQGYFNGSKAPFGYKTIEVGQTGLHGRIKKKLAIEESEASIVRNIFKLYTYGKEGRRMGIKEIAKHLNATGSTMRGKPWGIHKVHKILSSSTYAGTHVFNQRDGKTQKAKDRLEWIGIEVPAVVDQKTFEQATKLRQVHSPKKTNPRKASSPTLLTGLIRCGHCGSHMTIATGKSGQYRYYKCTNRMSKGNAACKSGNVPLEKLDNLVLDAFRQKVYTPEHIQTIIAVLRKESSKHKDGDKKQQIKKLETALHETEQALNRIYEAVERGFMKMDEHLKTRLDQHQQKRETLLAEVANLKRQQQSPLQTITPQKIKAASNILVKRFTEASSYAKAYLRATVSEIRIHDEMVSLSGDSQAMARLVANNAALEGLSTVPSTMHEWRRG